MNVKNFCITGGAGFIGSHFVRKISEEKKGGAIIGAIVVYDKLTYAADLNRLEGLNYTLVEGDICDTGLFYDTLRKYEITHILNFAAESHVDRSLNDDVPFLRTNILGTASILEAATRYWQETPDGFSGKQMIHISTDEVYGPILEHEKPADEHTALKPSNPYAATKAAADQLVIGKIAGEHFPAVIVRSSNNFGKGQHPEKLIPKVLQCLKNNQPIPLYGKGEQKRCWLSAVRYSRNLWNLVILDIKEEIYNVRGHLVLSNLELVQKMRENYAKNSNKGLDEISQIVFVEDRKCHDFFYNIDSGKFERLLEQFEGEHFDDQGLFEDYED